MANWGAAFGGALEKALPSAITLGDMIQQDRHREMLEKQGAQRLAFEGERLGMEKENAALQRRVTEQNLIKAQMEGERFKREEEFRKRQIPIETFKDHPLYGPMYDYAKTSGYVYKNPVSGAEFISGEQMMAMKEDMSKTQGLVKGFVGQKLAALESEGKALEADLAKAKESAAKKGENPAEDKKVMEAQKAWDTYLKQKEQFQAQYEALDRGEKWHREQVELEKKRADETSRHNKKIEDITAQKNKDISEYYRLKLANDKQVKAELQRMGKGKEFIGTTEDGFAVYLDKGTGQEIIGKTKIKAKPKAENGNPLGFLGPERPTAPEAGTKLGLFPSIVQWYKDNFQTKEDAEAAAKEDGWMLD